MNGGEEDLRQQIAAIASRFQIFECEPCADAIENFLRQQGIAGKRVKLYTGSALGEFGNIFHDGLQYNIATNSRHQAVEVQLGNQEIVFDNIHPKGIEISEWLANLHCMALDMGGQVRDDKNGILREVRMSLIELLLNIKKRPAMYLGRKSLSHLRTFLDGYGLAHRQLGIPISPDEQVFEQFQSWIEQRFNQPNTQSWDRIILFYTEDESSALTRFFELFEEFLSQHQISDQKSEVAVNQKSKI